MYRRSPLRSTSNTHVVAGLDMFDGAQAFVCWQGQSSWQGKRLSATLIHLLSKHNNKKQNNGNMGNRVGGKTITQYVAPCNPKQWDQTRHTSTKYICTSPRHNVIKPKGQNSGKETASQANKCRHNKIHMNHERFHSPPQETPKPPPQPRTPPPAPKTPQTPHVRNRAPSV